MREFSFPLFFSFFPVILASFNTLLSSLYYFTLLFLLENEML